ncbi:MAG: hypothetical protein IPK07_28065, partial [Deltaproteobacteria bacterium]|nr:hypothetical protein [Deltaproteobacteria bacterium]
MLTEIVDPLGFVSFEEEGRVASALIDGEPVFAAGTPRPTRSPIDGSRLARIVPAKADLTECAITAAARAFREWRV